MSCWDPCETQGKHTDGPLKLNLRIGNQNACAAPHENSRKPRTHLQLLLAQDVVQVAPVARASAKLPKARGWEDTRLQGLVDTSSPATPACLNGETARVGLCREKQARQAKYVNMIM